MQLQISQFVGQRQSVTVNAQLQQAICLLQLSNPELCSYLDGEAAENPFFEAQRPTSPTTLAERAKTAAAADFDDIGARVADHAPSLYAHVARQFDIMFADPRERFVADVFLEALEPSGWLGEPLDEIAARLGISVEECDAFLARIQAVEPAGLFARSLAECLALQAEDADVMTPKFRRLLENLPKLAAADLQGLCRACEVDLPELKGMLRDLRSFEPKPGVAFDGGQPPQRAPDLIVTENDTGWNVELNRSTLPAVKIDEAKAAVMRVNTDARSYVSDRLTAARWLRRAVEHRNQTALLVGSEIVRRQTAFLRHGPAHIVPMTLREVADAVGVHESTVSRITTGILIQTPQGTVGLKSFFSTALSTDGDSNASSAAVRHRIAELVKAEDPANPLSDDAIAATVGSEGTHLARRTVAKYRDMLGIPSSFQRRRLARLRKA